MGRIGIIGFLLAGFVGLAAPAIAADRQSVWLSSDSSAPDMLDLFRHPELWARARERVGVFKFVPPHVDPRIAAGRNSYAGLKDSGAFALLGHQGCSRRRRGEGVGLHRQEASRAGHDRPYR